MKWCLLVMLVVMPALAFADVPAKARGSATITGGDSAAARSRALDDAVRQAVDQTLAATLDPKVREASADVIKKRVLRRARAYVRELRVASEGADDAGVYAVEIDATVNDTQLAADLRALGVGVVPPVGTPMPDEPALPPARSRPTLALLLIEKNGEATAATFGRQGQGGGPAAAALGRELGSRGFKLVKTAGLEVPAGPATSDTPSGQPLDAHQSAALARAAGAGGALVGSAEIRDGGPIRGTRLLGAECHLALRLDDVTSGRLTDAQVDGAGFGADGAAAAAAAARDAATRAGRELGGRLDSHWPEDSAAPAGRGTTIRVRGAARWSDVDALARALGAVPGVQRVVLGRFARREVVLIVTGTAAARALADAAGQVAIPDLRVGARASAGEVAIELSGDASRPAPPPATPEAR